jgi:nucleotide-binding universal stress UspA family protein
MHVVRPEADSRETERALRHLEEAQGSLEQLGVKSEAATVEAADVLEAILQEAEAWNADMLLLGAPSASERTRLRGRDMGSQVARSANCPVLIVPRE